MLGFSLLSDEVMFKAVQATGGSYVNRKWVPATTTSTPSFVGSWEPFQPGQSNITLPQGVSSERTITIFTQENLAVANDLKGFVTDGDIVYIGDPTLDANEPPYRIIGKETWDKNQAFVLLESHIEYAATRIEKK